MARATRSSVQQTEVVAETPPPPATAARSKQGGKKRKRTSAVYGQDDGQPVTKQPKTESVIEEEEESPAAPEIEDKELPFVGDVPLDPGDAEKILDILEMADTQGLLDRVFPLPSDSTEPSASPPLSYSLRALLKESPKHSLRVLRTAIQHLFPISSHARSRPSTPAAQQLRFCNLALALLNQASFHSVSLPLDIETILPQEPETTDEVQASEEAKPLRVSTIATRPKSPSRKRKYALLQRLPTGDWWTSLNSDFAAPSDGKELKDLAIAHAELVAVLPTPSSTYAPLTSAPDLSLRHPTIGTLFPRKPPGPKQLPPGPRYITSGSFLDYGPYASFAPSFDQDGTEVGRDALGQVLWNREVKRRLKARQKALLARLEEEASFRTAALPQPELPPGSGAEPEPETVVVDEAPKEASRINDIEEALKGLLDPSEVDGVKSLLSTLELENAIQELLDRNARALQRLEVLQKERLGAEDGAFAQVEMDSEEWETAQAVMETLTVLASLRPRTSNSPDVPLTPSETVLRKLHRTLPISPSQGWYGTLQTSRSSALRDDTTLQIKAGTPIPPATAPATPAANKTNAPNTPASAYPGYYPYRAGGYTYPPGQAGAYYPTPFAGAQGQTNGSAYYGQYGQQGQYSYAGWYGYGTAAQQSGTTSQAGVSAGTYPAYYGANSATQTPPAQRAVANTVSKPYQQSTWTPSTPGYAAPTLPAHLRTSGNQGTNPAPATPQPATGTPSYQQYYSYPSAAR
ncbi:hypothetical protein NEOLEDRAFT_1068673 [Neolentinus lepideus HHB14362 ss-1]|uniref:Uncharacterized protein n=1 Tax=Neolentinus lepideus HHB14362 ss-1 TaxID=1314782 RepID=A0A165RI17_9AGAM|nr:hypothetical protein NEOLEDRAFT_1068673 [Neolentinus lepideus HHB14362 ss-1]